VQEDENENAELDEENAEGKLAWRGGRAEEATYEAGDAEDRAAEAAARKQAEQQEGDVEVLRSMSPVLCWQHPHSTTSCCHWEPCLFEPCQLFI